MEVTGHRTRAMFERYADLFSKEEKLARQAKAQERRREYRETQEAKVVPIRKAATQ